jgi:hypothetical protein
MPAEDGSYVPIKFTSAEKDLKDNEVVIFLDEEERSIFIWTGADSPVRKRFISSQIARQMRLEKGLTHRISTEDQGNETQKFWDFMERLKGTEILPSTLLEVTPPTGVGDLPESKVTTSMATKLAKARQEAKVERKPVVKATVTPPAPQTTPSPPPSPTSASVAAPKVTKIKPIKEIYYSVDQSTEVTPAKAKTLFPASDKNLILSTIHASTAAVEGKISLYCVPKTSKTASCKSEKPIFAIYLKPESSSIFELDDLEIPIPAGNSIYFTCPAKTFIGLNFES